MDIRIKIWRYALADERVWARLGSIPARAFVGPERDLFAIVQTHYLKFGKIPPHDIFEKIASKVIEDRERREAATGLFLRYYGGTKNGKLTDYDLDMFLAVLEEETLSRALEAADQALREGKRIGNKVYTGAGGAWQILESSKLQVETKSVDSDPWALYESRKGAEKHSYETEVLNAFGVNMEEGELWVITGFANEGKTTLALNTARELSRQLPVVYVTLEKAAGRMWWKIGSMELGDQGLTYSAFKDGTLSEEAENTFKGWYKERQKNFHIVKMAAGTGIGEVIMTAKSIISGRRGALVIDYIGLLGGSTRDDYMGSAMKRLMELTDMGWVVVALHQTNREGYREALETGRYRLYALASSNEVEKAADAVMWVMKVGFLHSRVGLMKFRESPIDLDKTAVLILNPETLVFEARELAEEQGGSSQEEKQEILDRVGEMLDREE